MTSKEYALNVIKTYLSEDVGSSAIPIKQIPLKKE